MLVEELQLALANSKYLYYGLVRSKKRLSLGMAVAYTRDGRWLHGGSRSHSICV